jgi:hypothetical protein
VSGVALLSIQPVDNHYVVGPYLSKGLGGVGPGVALGVTARISEKLVLLAEHSAAWISDEQSGRLVPQAQALGRLRDGVLTGLVGIALPGGDSFVVQPSGGFGVLFRPPMSGDVPVSAVAGRFVLVVGLDVIRSLTRRLDLVVGSRGYLFAGRGREAEYLGIGQHFVRVGAGLRLGSGGPAGGRGSVRGTRARTPRRGA